MRKKSEAIHSKNYIKEGLKVVTEKDNCESRRKQDILYKKT